jgi:hypothetical protein
MLVQAIAQVELAIVQTRQGLDVLQQQLDTDLGDYPRPPHHLLSHLDSLETKTKALQARTTRIQDQKQVDWIE